MDQFARDIPHAAAMEMGWDRQRDEETSVLPSPPDSVWGWWSMYNPPQDMEDVSD